MEHAQVRLVAAAAGMPAGSLSLARAEQSPGGHRSGLEAPASDEEDEVRCCSLLLFQICCASDERALTRVPVLCVPGPDPTLQHVAIWINTSLR